jgi:uncharacterized protein VirK/YbjX
VAGLEVSVAGVSVAGNWPLRAPAPVPTPAAAPVSVCAAAAVLHPAETRGWMRGRAKFIARAVLQPVLTRAWLDRLGQAPERSIWQARPRLAGKLQRPFVHRDWNAAARLAALETHYDVLGSLVAAGALDRIYRSGMTLVRIEASGSGRIVDLRVAYTDQFEKEGELTLAVVDAATALELATLTFCIAGAGGERSIWIGGLQANPAAATRVLINDVSKEMHGLRPKALALWALRQLARTWEIDRLQAVADEHHIYRHRHKRRAFSASYDQFWSESGGVRQAQGWELPLETAERPAAELKASRRKAHARRYAMLAELAPRFTQAVEQLAADHPAAAGTFSYTPARAAKLPAATGELEAAVL